MGKTTKSRHAISKLIGIVCSISFLVIVFLNLDIDQARNVLASARLELYVAAFGFYLLAVLIAALRLYFILDYVNTTKPPIAILLQGIAIAYTLNCVLPAKGGDAVKAVFFKKRIGFVGSIAAVVLERLTDVVTLGLLGLVAYFFGGVELGLLVGSGILGLAAVAFGGVLFFPQDWAPVRFKFILDEFHVIVRSWIKKPILLLVSSLGSLGIWGLGAMSVYSLSCAVFPESSFYHIMTVFPVATLAGMLPISFSGVGVRDATFAYLLSSHMPFEQAAIVGLSFTFIAYWLPGLLCSPIALYSLRNLKLQRKGQSDAK